MLLNERLKYELRKKKKYQNELELNMMILWISTKTLIMSDYTK